MIRRIILIFVVLGTLWGFATLSFAASIDPEKDLEGIEAPQFHLDLAQGKIGTQKAVSKDTNFNRNKVPAVQENLPPAPRAENPTLPPEISIDEKGNGILTAADGTKKVIFVKAPYIHKITMTKEQQKINAENLRRMNKKNHGLIVSPKQEMVGAFKVIKSNNKQPINTFPSRFDLREHNWVTPPKDQGLTCGACVMFATMGAVESNALMKYGISMDLSENHLKNVIGQGSDHCSGAPLSSPATSGYMTGWAGPAWEQQDPYNNGMSPTSPQGLQPRLHTQNIYIFNRGNIGEISNDLKWAIMNHGGGMTSAWMDVGCFSNNTLSPYYYCSQPGLANHAMTIVGWDNSISQYNFIDSYGNMPAGDGAFIVKDSYGTTPHDNGFVYLSYYDLRLGIFDKVYFYDTDYIPGSLPVYYGSPFSENNYYHYDVLVGLGSYPRPPISRKWGSVTYTAKRNEKITAIGFGIANGLNISMWPLWLFGLNYYEVYVYTNSDYNIPLSGTLVAQASGTINVGFDREYRTIRLPNPVIVNKGQNFSIVLKMWANGYGQNNGQLPVDQASFYSGVQTSKSFFSQDGVNWESGQHWEIVAPYYPVELGVTVFTHSDSDLNRYDFPER